MRRAYSTLYLLLLPFVLARLWWRGRANPAYRERWRERLGRYAGTVDGPRPFWIHAVSVGEVAASAPLVKALRERYPAHPVLFTTTTPTGRDAVERQFGQGVAHAYFPYDVERFVERFVQHFQPRALLLMETELWPNVMAVCGRRRLPVLLVNGRLSAQSARRYGWIAPLVRPMLASLTRAAVQADADAERLCALGMPPERVVVTGSLKFDLHVPASIYEEGAALRRELGQSRPLLMAGSTRPGEEELLIAAFRRLRERFPTALMVLAPRHPERFAEVTDLCRREGLTVHLRSAGGGCAREVDIFLLDTMGELMRFYAACDVAFVGGSLQPLGGHNVLEPAAVGVPVVTGPHMFNFLDITQKLVIGGSLKIAENTTDIADITVHWLANSDLRDAAGRGGRAIVEANRGATQRVLEMVDALPGQP